MLIIIFLEAIWLEKWLTVNVALPVVSAVCYGHCKSVICPKWQKVGGVPSFRYAYNKWQKVSGCLLFDMPSTKWQKVSGVPTIWYALYQMAESKRVPSFWHAFPKWQKVSGVPSFWYALFQMAESKQGAFFLIYISQMASGQDFI